MSRNWIMSITLSAIFALSACASSGGAKPSGHEGAHGEAVGIKVLGSVPVAEKLDGKDAQATTLEVSLAPGAGSPPHRHPGPVYGYVAEGEFETKLGNQPTQTLKAGASFYEPTMILHAIGRNPSNSGRTRLIVVIVHPRDAKELVLLEPTSATK